MLILDLCATPTTKVDAMTHGTPTLGARTQLILRKLGVAVSMYINLHTQVKPKDLAIHGEKDVCVASDWSFSTRAADQTWIYCCGVSNAVAASSKKGSGIEQSSSPTSVTKVA